MKSQITTESMELFGYKQLIRTAERFKAERDTLKAQRDALREACVLFVEAWHQLPAKYCGEYVMFEAHKKAQAALALCTTDLR